ncbi:MAG: hypothetical protein KDA62_15575 [Planctomycetales bacterium]|nr:hypothetical protein [Planctomycetales bacterium]
MSPDAVGVSITMVDIPDTAEQPYADLWNEIDEQAIPVEMRRRLEANGLRCGHISGQLPQRILDQFNSSEDLSGLAEGDFRAIDTSLSARAELRQLRAGQPSKIALTKQPVGQVHVLENEGGQLRGETFEQAQCLFRLTAFPTGDGRSRLELVPEIHHGQWQQRWIGYDGAMRLDADRQRRAFEHLKFESILSPGEVLIVGSSSDLKGLGGQFLKVDDAETPKRKCLLLRLSQTQMDDRFAPGQESAPIVTAGE